MTQTSEEGICKTAECGRELAEDSDDLCEWCMNGGEDPNGQIVHDADPVMKLSMKAIISDHWPLERFVAGFLHACVTLSLSEIGGARGDAAGFLAERWAHEYSRVAMALAERERFLAAQRLDAPQCMTCWRLGRPLDEPCDDCSERRKL